jgi:hypothetical protein
MVDAERQVGNGRLADWLAVVDSFSKGQGVEVLLNTVCDLVENIGAFCRGGCAPGIFGGMSRIERLLNVLGCGPGYLAQGLASHWSDIGKVLSLCRRNPGTADKVIVTRTNSKLLTQLVDHILN